MYVCVCARACVHVQAVVNNGQRYGNRRFGRCVHTACYVFAHICMYVCARACVHVNAVVKFTLRVMYMRIYVCVCARVYTCVCAVLNSDQRYGNRRLGKCTHDG